MQKISTTLFFLGLCSLTLSLQGAQDPNADTGDTTSQTLGCYQHHTWCAWKDKPCIAEWTFCPTCFYETPKETTSNHTNDKPVKTKEKASLQAKKQFILDFGGIVRKDIRAGSFGGQLDCPYGTPIKDIWNDIKQNQPIPEDADDLCCHFYLKDGTNRGILDLNSDQSPQELYIKDCNRFDIHHCINPLKRGVPPRNLSLQHQDKIIAYLPIHAMHTIGETIELVENTIKDQGVEGNNDPKTFGIMLQTEQKTYDLRALDADKNIFTASPIISSIVLVSIISQSLTMQK